MLPSTLISSPHWWPIHLGECACASGNDAYDYIFEAFGICRNESSAFYLNTLHLEEPLGTWPSFSLIDGNHSLVITYFGEPRHEVTYGLSANGQSTTWASDCGNCMLPGFRWDEIIRFSDRLDNSDSALLLLLPSADIPKSRAVEARERIETSLGRLGYRSPLISRLAADLTESLVSDRVWYEDPEFGWLTDDIKCWRSRKRIASGLEIPDDHAFKQLKAWVDQLNTSVV